MRTISCDECGEDIYRVANGWSHTDEPDLNADHEPVPNPADLLSPEALVEAANEAHELNE